MLIDGVDKIGREINGDLASAPLEMLDPEHNNILGSLVVVHPPTRIEPDVISAWTSPSTSPACVSTAPPTISTPSLPRCSTGWRSLKSGGTSPKRNQLSLVPSH